MEEYLLEIKKDKYEIIHIIFTTDDIESMAEEVGVEFDIALERAKAWSPFIEDTAVNLISDQLYNAVEFDSP